MGVLMNVFVSVVLVVRTVESEIASTIGCKLADSSSIIFSGLYSSSIIVVNSAVVLGAVMMIGLLVILLVLLVVVG